MPHHEVDKSVVLYCHGVSMRYHHECTRLSSVILLVAKLLLLFQFPTTHTHTHIHTALWCWSCPSVHRPQPAAWQPLVPILCCSGCCRQSACSQNQLLESSCRASTAVTVPPWAAPGLSFKLLDLTPLPLFSVCPCLREELFLQVLALWDPQFPVADSTLTPVYMCPCIMFSLDIFKVAPDW